MSQTITEPVQTQPTAPADGHLHLTSEPNDAIVSQPPQAVDPPGYNESQPSEKAAYGYGITEPAPPVQPAPVQPANPPPNVQPGLENRQPITLGELSETPSCVVCPYCEWRVITRVEKHSGDHAMKMGLIACLCLGLLCAWLPCVIDDCKDSEHFCTKCGYQLAIFEKGAAGPKIIMTEGKVKSLRNPVQNPNANAAPNPNAAVNTKS